MPQLGRYEVENVLLHLPYKETVSMCASARQYRDACNDRSFWKKKALARYGIDLDKISELKMNDRDRYMVLESIAEAGYPGLCQGNRNGDILDVLSGNEYMWQRLLQNVFDLGDADVERAWFSAKKFLYDSYRNAAFDSRRVFCHAAYSTRLRS